MERERTERMNELENAFAGVKADVIISRDIERTFGKIYVYCRAGGGDHSVSTAGRTDFRNRRRPQNGKAPLC